jgi:DNA polymerase-4
VEVRENSALAGKPLIVGHAGARGVVATCSYEARRFGVRSAMPSVVAARLCPGAVWLAPRMALYGRISRQVHRILRRHSPVVEPLSIDEAFLDLTGIALDLDAGRTAALRIKQEIRAEHGLTASAGVAPNKFLAKIASDLEKPDGLVVLPPAALSERLWPLPLERLWGVGPKTAGRLRRGGFETIGSLLRVPEAILAGLVGEGLAAHLCALARGEDARGVEVDRQAKSISEERTYAEDLVDPEIIDRALLARAEGVARQLRRQRLTGRTVHLKVRRGDYKTWTRATTLPDPTNLTEPILRAARELFRERIRLAGAGVRLLGVGVSGLQPAAAGQGLLFGDAAGEPARRVDRAADAVRNRLGEDAVTRARLIGRDARAQRVAREPVDPPPVE